MASSFSSVNQTKQCDHSLKSDLTVMYCLTVCYTIHCGSNLTSNGLDSGGGKRIFDLDLGVFFIYAKFLIVSLFGREVKSPSLVCVQGRF